ncbi:hypothetical protein C8R45DRAFT_944597 [Mycena sanguinolenta]|nr:hypothetical protein C8R45DRAFT_944597 [Mycena sanguinolenta]
MKYLVYATLLFVAVCLTSASNLGHTRMTRSAQTCGDPADALPMYRIYDASIPSRFYTFDVTTVSNSIKSAYVLETVAAMVFSTQEEGTVPFYRLVDPALNIHFWTINTTEVTAAVQTGYTVNTVAQMYIYPTETCGSVPLYRVSGSAGKDSVYTTSDTERLNFVAQGFTDLGIAGYVLPFETVQCAC